MHLSLVEGAEWALTILLLALAFAVPRLGAPAFERVEAALGPWVDRPGRQLVLVGFAAILIRAVFLPLLGPPTPLVPDEFSMLLQAHDLAQGRWASPAQADWPFFEAMHLISQPTYGSIYFPGRSAPLALGLLLASNAWIGVWLSMVAMCVAIAWMLQGWTSPRYAALGALIVVVRYGAFSYWVDSYWGGAFTATGAILILGTVPRVLHAASWALGAATGLGALILMTSRPFEGAVFCVVVGAALAPWGLRSVAGGEWGRLLKIGAPVGLFVALGLGLLASQAQATTGHMLKTPYDLSREQYAVAPALVISPKIQRTSWSDPQLEVVYKGEAKAYDRFHTLKGTIGALVHKVLEVWAFYVGPALLLPFLFGLGASRRWPVLPAALGVGFLAFCLTTWDFVHYLAPAMGLAVLLITLGFERLRAWRWRDRPVGLFLARTLPLVMLVNVLPPASSLALGWPRVGTNHWSRACCAIQRDSERARIERLLHAGGGRSLVFVRFGPNSDSDWVYNTTPIGVADIVWAREKGAADQTLIARFPDRKAWRVLVAEGHAQIEPYRP